MKRLIGKVIIFVTEALLKMIERRSFKRRLRQARREARKPSMKNTWIILLLLAALVTSACGLTEPTSYLGELHVVPALVEMKVGSTAHFKASGGNGVYHWILVEGPGVLRSDRDTADYTASKPGQFRILVQSSIGTRMQQDLVVGGAAG